MIQIEMRTFLVSLFLIIFISAPAFGKTEPEIRVLINESASGIVVYSSSAISVSSSGKAVDASLPPDKRTNIMPGKSGITVGDKLLKLDEISLASKDGTAIWLDGKGYSGKIVIKRASERNLSVINIVSLEDYVAGTLYGELPLSWPLETLKAQAVASRTYAISILSEKTGDKDHHIRATIEDQVFKGLPPPSSDAHKAAGETFGEILTYHKKPIKARFHSSCGGETELSIHVWGEKDISKKVKDPYCKEAPHNRWKTSLSPQFITKNLRSHGFDPGKIESIKIEKQDSGGRVAAVAIHGSRQTISLNGNDFRRYLGFSKIKSTKFEVKKNGKGFLFSGSGFGHGVGMCQWGARGMAESGFDYKKILGFYYPGTSIKRLY